MGSGGSGFLRRLVHEPLIHFLLAGAAVLALGTGWTKWAGDQRHRIVVSAARVQELVGPWEAQQGRPPTAKERQALIDDYVREEIFYREAVTSQLDREDTIIRRHLSQKVEFLAQSLATATEPSEDDLQAHYRANRERYARPARVTFSQVYFAISRGPAESRRAAAAERDWIQRQRPAVDLATRGDASMWSREVTSQTRNELRDTFGVAFADQVFGLPVGEWAGPVLSAYGWHAVRVGEVEPETIAPFDEVRHEVALELRDKRSREAVAGYFTSLRPAYTVVVATDPDVRAGSVAAR